MSISNLSMQELLEVCKTYGASVKEGSGRVTIAAKEFEVEELFKSTHPLHNKRPKGETHV